MLGAVLALTLGACAAPAAIGPTEPPTVEPDTPAPTATLPSATPPPTPAPTPTATPSPTPGPVTGQLVNRPIGTVDGASMGFAEYLPAGYGDGTPRPLLIYNHGSAESGDGSDRSLNALRGTAVPWVIDQGRWPQERPFVVLAPQHDPRADVSPCTTADEIDAFLEFALAHYDVDPDRVYLTGVSCGAIGEWEYLAAHSNEVVAGVVAIAGDGRDAFAAAGCDIGLVPIWAIHGDADLSVDVEGSIEPITELQACTDPAPAEAKLTVLPHVGHAFWDVVYDTQLFTFKGGDIYEWLLSHSRS